MKNFYTPGDLRKFLPTIPYSSGNVTNNIDIFLKYLKLAIILVNNNDNAIIQEYFKSRYSEDKYYNIGDRGTRSFSELRELFAGNGMIGYVAKERVDGKLVLPEAIKLLKMKAAS